MLSGVLTTISLSSSAYPGLGHYDSVSTPTKLGGDIAGVPIVQIATYGDCCLAVSADGEIFGWGNSEYLQLASITELTQVRKNRKGFALLQFAALECVWMQRPVSHCDIRSARS